MEAVGRLTSGVAHELNNVLTIVQSFTELLEHEVAGQQVALDYVDFISRATQRAHRLTRELLAFSRPNGGSPQVVTFNDIASNTLSMLRNVIGEGIMVERFSHRNPWAIKVDPAQFEQVLLNLAVNARDAMPNGGTLTIETHNVELDGVYAKAHGVALETGDYAVLVVSDTGCGVPKDDQPHVFEPYFTTKAEGQGTGLGLSTSYEIVKHAGGFIWVYSEAGIGTTFKLYIPRSHERPEPVEGPARPRPQQHGTETLLLVEDDAQVRALFASTLSDLGYTVLTAIDGVDALAVAETSGRPIDLLVSDVVLPRMNGPALAEALASSCPNLPVLYMSGYTRDVLRRKELIASDVPLLEKPLTPRLLGETIRDMLEPDS